MPEITPARARNRMKRAPMPGLSANNIGSEYSQAELEALNAVGREISAKKRSLLVTEIIRVLVGLGWRRVEEIPKAA